MSEIRTLSQLPDISDYDFRFDNQLEDGDIFQLSILSGGGVYRSSKVTYDEIRNNISDPIYARLVYANPISETSGMVKFSNQFETHSGSADDTVISPLLLRNELDLITDNINGPASETEAGVIQLATSVEALDGVVPDKAITPLTLNDVINYATNGLSGMVEFATDVEATAGILENVVINPKQLKDNIDLIPSQPDASTSTKGIIEIATDVETRTGTSGVLSITPSTLKYMNSMIHVLESETVGVSSNTPLSGGYWIDRDINTVEHNTITDGSLDTGTNEITLPVGTYRIDGSAKISGSTSIKHSLRLVDNTTGSPVVEFYGIPIEGTSTTMVYINGTFTVSSSHKYKLQHYVDTDIGGGDAINISPIPEVYCDATIYRIYN